MPWERSSAVIDPAHMNLWDRIKIVWQLLRNKTEFRITVHFTSPEGETVYLDDVNGRWVTKGDK